MTSVIKGITVRLEAKLASTWDKNSHWEYYTGEVIYSIQQEHTNICMHAPNTWHFKHVSVHMQSHKLPLTDVYFIDTTCRGNAQHTV